MSDNTETKPKRATKKISDLCQPLPDNEIELRVGNIFKYGDQHACIMLAYKTARADARRLDDVVGPMDWQKKYYQDAKGNTVCSIDVWDSTKKQWVTKEDVGEDNIQGCKGTYSDAFKRAGFAWGIGRELYELPVLFVNLTNEEVTSANGKYKQSSKLKIQKWSFSRIMKGSSMTVLLTDEKGSVRFKDVSDLDERNSVKKYMNTNTEDKFYNDISVCNNIDDLNELLNEAGTDYIITESHKKMYFTQKELIESGEVINYEDKNSI